MNSSSFHTHSTYCDGKKPVEDFILQAIDLRMKSIGFSSHAPLPVSVLWSMPQEQLKYYVAEINALKKKYKSQIDVFLSLEMDHIPGITRSFNELKKENGLDYTIGSVHLVKPEAGADLWFLDGPDTNYCRGLELLFGGDIQKAVRAYYNQVIDMVKTQKPDVVGHIDKVKMNNKGRFFSEEEHWYKGLVDETLEAVKQAGSIVEVNTRGIYKKKSDCLFPDGYFLSECKRLEIPVTISSDAHHPDELVAGCDVAALTLKNIGYKSIMLFDKAKWCAVALQ